MERRLRVKSRSSGRASHTENGMGRHDIPGSAISKLRPLAPTTVTTTRYASPMNFRDCLTI
jgi:hypothetical protein